MNSKEYIRDKRSPKPKDELTSKIMSSIKAKNTKPEIWLRKELWSNGVRGYRLHWSKVPGKPDIAFPSKKIAVLVHGCYWHRCPHCNPSFPKTNQEFWKAKFEKNIARDKRNISDLKALGWEVAVIWECQIKSNIDECVKRIKDLL